MLRFACLIAVAGCGRISFDPLESPTDSLGPDAVAGPAGMGLRVDGTSYADIDSLCPALTGAFTFETWFRPSSTHVDPDAAAVLAINDASGATNLSLLMWDWQTAATSYFDDFMTMRTVDGTVLAPPDEWHFLAFTYDSSEALVYSDGQPQTTARTPRTVTAPCQVSLGQEWDGGATSDFVVGTYDEASVWSRAKSATEIVADMHANASGDEPDLVALYHFETTTEDGGSGHPLTLHGTAALVPVP